MINLLFILMILLQIADGVLTYLGVCQFGIHAEGNPLIRQLISTVGPLLALLIAKLSAILALLWMKRSARQEIERYKGPFLWVFSTVTFFYFVSACLWVYFLSNNLPPH